MLTHVHIQSHICLHTYMLIHTCSHMFTYSHIYAYTHTCSYTHVAHNPTLTHMRQHMRQTMKLWPSDRRMHTSLNRLIQAAHSVSSSAPLQCERPAGQQRHLLSH
ncbi:hypothetical protein LEMLEM_LOCUS8537 [Lemmus lemmus]